MTNLSKIVIALSIPALLLTGWLVFNDYTYSNSENVYPKEPTETPLGDRYRTNLTGKFTCLPTDAAVTETEKCAFGMKTDTGEYYAVDFAFMSQPTTELLIGDYFSANGIVTPIEMFSSDRWRDSSLAGMFAITDSLEKKSYACNADAKICPDGSAVGRTGPQCEFTACPPLDRSQALVTTYLGGVATSLNVSITPSQLISDSRCPSDVQCVWAGTVEVLTALATPVAHGEHLMKLGEEQRFGDFIVTLLEVSPYPKPTESIAESSYRFTYSIERQ